MPAKINYPKKYFKFKFWDMIAQKGREEIAKAPVDSQVKGRQNQKIFRTVKFYPNLPPVEEIGNSVFFKARSFKEG